MRNIHYVKRVFMGEDHEMLIISDFSFSSIDWQKGHARANSPLVQTFLVSLSFARSCDSLTLALPQHSTTQQRKSILDSLLAYIKAAGI